MSLKQTILEHLKSKYPAIIHKGEIGRLAVNVWGYENENAGRRCRELVHEGKIKRYLNNKHEAEYQYILNSSDMPSQYKPVQRNQEISSTDDKKPVSAQKPHSVPVNAPQTKWQKSPDFFRPLQKCCPIALLCFENNLPIQHSQGCNDR